MSLPGYFKACDIYGRAESVAGELEMPHPEEKKYLIQKLSLHPISHSGFIDGICKWCRKR